MTVLPEIRRLAPREIDTLLGWAADEGWNPGLNDRIAFQAADPDGFFGCFVNGAMAAGISAVRYGADFGFIGLYIARPDFRGRGLGRLVWDAGLQHLEGRTIGLDGEPQQQANYRKMGFVGDYDTCRWTGSPPKPAQICLDGEIRPITDADFADILRLDRAHFPTDRREFLSEFLKPPSKTMMIVRNGRAVAYGVARPCRDRFKIGPLFAADLCDAKALFRRLAAVTGTSSIDVDVPLSADGFPQWLESLGYVRGFSTTRMYRGQPPALGTSGIHAVTTLELG